MDSARYVKIAERADGKWDYHMMAARGNLPDEETFSSRQGYGSAGEASTACMKELMLIRGMHEEPPFVVVRLSHVSGQAPMPPDAEK